jgi:hypothetical protein
MAKEHHKADPELVKTPVEYLCGDPEAHEHEKDEGIYDGEPGLPKRTAAKDHIPSLIRDEAPGLPKRKG